VGGHTFNRLEVVTFNHKLRPEADEEVKFVKSVASSYGLPCHVKTALPNQLIESKGIQERSRIWRTAECIDIITKLQSHTENKEDSQWVVAMAHQSDDQLETVLLKFLRGVHISQIRGMKPHITIKFEATSEKVKLIRPLLNISKSELKEYLLQHDKVWREDASNMSRVCSFIALSLFLFLFPFIIHTNNLSWLCPTKILYHIHAKYTHAHTHTHTNVSPSRNTSEIS